MSASPSNARKPGAFAVYCGDGVYVDAVPDHSINPFIRFVSHRRIDGAAMSRARAVGVCHAVRRVGVSAWVVRAGGAA